MEIKKIKAALAAIVIMGLTFTACSGDDGEQGPAGAPGNANVNSSNGAVAADDWTAGAILKDTLMVPEITQSVVDNGAVMVYLKIDDGVTPNDSPWEALTYTRAITGLAIGGDRVGVDMFIEYGYNVGMVILSVKNTLNLDLSAILQNYPPNDYLFKVVVIPPAALVEGVDVNDYDQVKMVYGIQEFDM